MALSMSTNRFLGGSQQSILSRPESLPGNAPGRIVVALGSVDPPLWLSGLDPWGLCGVRGAALFSKGPGEGFGLLGFGADGLGRTRLEAGFMVGVD